MLKFDEEMKLKDVEKKALNLKLKANRNTTRGFGNFWDSPAEDNSTTSDIKNEFSQLKLELIKELRDTKDHQMRSS